MTPWPRRRMSPAGWCALGVGVATGVYAAYVGNAWRRYGRPSSPRPDEEDPLLDQFMPEPEVAERHAIRVAAAAATTFAVARDFDLFGMPVPQALFKTRAFILGAKKEAESSPHGLVSSAQAIGWVVLAEIPDREVILGAVTRPWEANVTFRSIAPQHFADFNEPDYVKIVWTLRADPIDATHSMFRTETRVIATDQSARRRFRRYWSLLSAGIVLIRWAALVPLKREAERWARVTAPHAHPSHSTHQLL
jgi:hypothetical protein